jgi:hypothetical protein
MLMGAFLSGYGRHHGANRHKNKKPSLTGAGDGTLSWLEGFKAKSGRRHGWSDNNST